jgi:hypothetical protein
MRFLSLYTPSAENAATPPSAQHMAEMGQLAEEMTKAGVLLATGAFVANSLGARVRSVDGTITVTEGLPTGPRDRAHGFALLQVSSRPEMFSVVERFLKVAGDGECELHVLMDGPPER